ncbi:MULTISPECIES: DNA starvation/stationary phase protection protein Dps [unclassified Aureimonas]|uniref:DNA starvation/stationary phase protection protein Dps n=1 Tax=unclassified Aureimonas TaxID=2615206 RepID=UPI0006FB8650|nr:MULTISPECIES: DNA starvation/stationary phase protection protein Dps [unclassified Aureimonas]KQT66012.1 DNA starvation/stationary phase protection protein [Aureimonas sp. Leaf427]KQT73370.1 DNA starvation/stationary phase protection protein [Aureimonas sp. Leaf460]
MAKTPEKKNPDVLLHATKNPQKENVRGAMVPLLQKHLGTAIDLSYQAKQAHWNVKGMNFIAVHKLFDELHEQAEGYVDLIAERLTGMGGQAQGTVQASAANSILQPYALDIVHAEDHLRRLSDSYAAWSEALMEGIEEADDAGDDLTADLLTEVGRGINTSLYFLESHFQVKPGRAI